MVNFWEETAVDRSVRLGYEGLAEIIRRIETGRETYQDRARVLVLADEIEVEGNGLAQLAVRLRALAAGGRDAVDMVGGGALPSGGVPGV